MELSHLNEAGEARMVDVSSKGATSRKAVAHASIKMNADTLDHILSGQIEKGDVFAAARIAGIMAAKRTPELIPLCHPIMLSHAAVDIKAQLPDSVEIIATVTCVGATGVEMEALNAACISALTIYDMCKAIDRGMEITDIYLVYKSGGKSGEFNRK
jgi:cyclic pyranopterin phosphate synthase